MVRKKISKVTKIASSESPIHGPLLIQSQLKVHARTQIEHFRSAATSEYDSAPGTDLVSFLPPPDDFLLC